MTVALAVGAGDSMVGGGGAVVEWLGGWWSPRAVGMGGNMVDQRPRWADAAEAFGAALVA